MSRVAESNVPMQAAENITVSNLTREQLDQIIRAAMVAVESDALKHWALQDKLAFTHGLTSCLAALRLTDGRDDAVIGLQLGNAVLHAVNSRSTGYAGHTWGSLRAAIDQLVALSEDVASIEFGTSEHHSRCLKVERDEHGAVEIYAVRRA